MTVLINGCYRESPETSKSDTKDNWFELKVSLGMFTYTKNTIFCRYTYDVE